MFLFHLLRIFLIKTSTNAARPDRSGEGVSLLYANLGDNATLPCSNPRNVSVLSWYKQAIGDMPQQMLHYNRHSTNAHPFINQFEDDARFSVDIHRGHLKIAGLRQTDSAVYYCATVGTALTEFKRGTVLIVKEPSHRYYSQQPPSRPVRLDRSLTLNCTVRTQTCEEESDGDEACEWSTRLCTHSSPKSAIGQSDAETHYCAVALCGEIPFGKVTRGDGAGEGNGPWEKLPAWVHCLEAALLLSFLLNVALASILYNMAKGRCVVRQGIPPPSGAPAESSHHQGEELDGLQYAALDFSKAKAVRQKGSEDETIYSRVRR